MKRASIQHEFVEDIPEQLEDGVLYISIRYRTASHLCACGCGDRVVTPIKPPKWHLTFDGDTVSLSPSVGNWQQPCRSHYWIRNNQVDWAKPWTDKHIAAGRAEDRSDLRDYYAGRRRQQAGAPPKEPRKTLAGRVFDTIRRLMGRVGDQAER